MTERDIEVGDFVRTEYYEGVVIGIKAEEVKVETGWYATDFDFDEIVEVSEFTVDCVKGFSVKDESEYGNKVTEIEENQGQQEIGTYASFAISSLDWLWVIDDVMELCGCSRATARRVIEREQIKGYCEVVDRAKTGGRPKTVYKTINQGDDDE